MKSPQNSSRTHLLTTNSIPTQHDRNIIYNTLSSINKDICQAEIDIAQLKKVLEERITDRAALIQYRDSLAAVVSLLRQLPLEIFGQIFAYATLDDRRFPISASHVCQLWRRASLANSDLWTTIWIGNRCQKEYMALFIQRSQSRPMSLKYSENLPLQSLPNVSTTLSDMGCDCRWKEIHVHPSWEFLPKLLSKSWDTLESLVLTALGNSWIRTVDLTSATRLMRLSIIHDKRPRVMCKFFKLPCSGLTHLNMDITIRLNEVISILSECGNLEECVLTLAILFMYDQDTPPQTHVHLPNLRKLHLHMCVLDRLVKLIKAPVVEDLLLHPLDGSRQLNWTDEGVIEFINASKSTLRKFAISAISQFDAIVLLEGMNKLCEFRVIGNDDFEEGVLERMILKDREMVTAMSGDTDDEVTDEGGHEIFLPKLEVLYVICKTYFHVQKAFIDMVHSRWWPEDDSSDRAVARLKTASLKSISMSERLVFGAEVEEIRCQGFDIQMLDPENLLEGEEADWLLD